MTHDENPFDAVLTWDLRDTLIQLRVPQTPPLAAITGRGRARQRRRMTGFASLGATAVAGATALALSLTGALGTASAGNPSAIHAKGSAGSTGTGRGTIRSAGFVLTSDVNGTDTLTLTMGQVLDPATLQQALTERGIPALVKMGTYCTSNPAPPDPVSAGVLSPFRPPSGVPHKMVPAPSGPAPSGVQQNAADTTTVIDPAAIPSGTELFFGYSASIHAVFTDLIYASSYTCSSNP